MVQPATASVSLVLPPSGMLGLQPLLEQQKHVLDPPLAGPESVDGEDEVAGEEVDGAVAVAVGDGDAVGAWKQGGDGGVSAGQLAAGEC